MEVTAAKNAQVAQMRFASVYPHYVAKCEKKGRTVDELHAVIEWLTGYTPEELHDRINRQVSFEAFFGEARLNANADKITGVICGYRIEDIPDAFAVYRQVRYLDKLVDELAKGKSLETIMRK